MKFKKAYKKLIVFEGGYVNDPQDKGGETYKGISRKYNPDWCGWEMIDELKEFPGFPENLKENERRIEPCVEKFYKQNYWDKLYCDSFRFPVAMELFEQAVNLGVKRAVKHLQRVLNILAKKDVLKIDGVIGSRTLALASDVLHNGYVNLAVKILNVLQGCKYIEIMERDASQRKFVGWFNRG